MAGSERSSGALRHLLGRVARRTGLDRRTAFRRLDQLPPHRRRARTPGIQFISAHPNIGNSLPVLGIQQMLGRELDTWSIHDKRVDFEFVNRSYRYAIIGGAGLLYSSFRDFWSRFADECRIPFVVWGVGGCFPDSDRDPGVDRAVVKPLLEAAELVNLRDQGTADFYGCTSAHISACPTIVHLKYLRRERAPRPGSALFATHEPLVGAEESAAFERALEGAIPDLSVTDNTQTRWLGLRDILRRHYLPSELVIASRLHGAIIAYGLGIPYIAIARDQKLREFQKTYGNGILVESVDELEDAIRRAPSVDTATIAYGPVERFGERASALLADLSG